MALKKYKLGDYIEKLDNRNTCLDFDEKDVRGVNNLKQFMPTKVDISSRDLTKFQIVKPDEFVFNHRTSRNGSKFSIAYNNGEKPVICTEDYVVFRIKQECKKQLSAYWLYIYFNRSEFDRYVITNSWGSSTEFYNWDDLCNIEIPLPPISIQQKYVDIYKALVANQASYERGLEDLKLACDGYIEDLRKKQMHCFNSSQLKQYRLGELIEQSFEYNNDLQFNNGDVIGVTINKELIATKADVTNADISKFLIVRPNNFVYNPRTHGEKIGLGYNNTNKTLLITCNNTVFKIKHSMLNTVLPEYLMFHFRRSEWDREACYRSWGSSTVVFSWETLCEMEIYLPSLSIQRSIADIYMVYAQRKSINEQLKAQIRDICPILIKGSIEEARKQC